MTLIYDLEEIVAEALEALCLVHMGPRLPLLLFNLLPFLCKALPGSIIQILTSARSTGEENRT